MQDPRLVDKNQPRDVDPALMCFPEDPLSLALDLDTVPPINGRFIATQAVGVFLATSSNITTPIPGHSNGPSPPTTSSLPSMSCNASLCWRSVHADLSPGGSLWDETPIDNLSES
ncbi:hypothetical protein [Bradyrhizobium sp. WSM2793]|uniref:hypothetical protein n=1 Tax=Bradyrhizobium sp. WSM2793 TaxID=1038866 RepID=UPI0012FCF472|nr:hypothetical protein [Bradyrhizobium sp. WSM2793]